MKKNFRIVLLGIGMMLVASVVFMSCGKDAYKTKYEQEVKNNKILQDQISAKDRELLDLQSQISDAQSRANAAEAAKAGLESQITDLQGQIASKDATIAQLEDQLANASDPAEVAALEQQINQLYSEKAALEQELSQKQRDLNDARATIAQLQQQIVDLQAELLAAQQAANIGPLQFETMGAMIGTMRANIAFWLDLGRQVEAVEVVSYGYAYYPNYGTGNLETGEIPASQFHLYKTYDFDAQGAYPKGKMFTLSAPIPAELMDLSNDLNFIHFVFKYKLNGSWFQTVPQFNVIEGIGGFWNFQYPNLKRVISPESNSVEIPKSIVDYNELWQYQMENLQ